MTFKLDPAAPECATPLMKQFIRLKGEAPGAILFFRMGDFYELFGEDAVSAAPVLGVTLTSRDKKSENPIPMAGVPFHSATAYIQKLLNAGHRVAIAEQILPEGMTADQIKGIVERKIVRIFTPAVQFEMSGDPKARFLGTLSPAPKGRFVLALLEPATGEIRISGPLDPKDLLAEPRLLDIRHFLVASTEIPASILTPLENTPEILVEEVARNLVSTEGVLPLLQKQFGKLALHPLLEDPAAARALAFLIQYVLKTQGQETLPHLHEPRALRENDRLTVGPHTHHHLDTADLLSNIQNTATSMGARFLRAELEAPLRDLQTLHSRQAAIRELSANSPLARSIHEELKNVYDLDWILGRVAAGLASPRDTWALGQSFASAFRFSERIASFESTDLKNLSSAFEETRIALTLDLASAAPPKVATGVPF
ncbi:MAG: hypothetical protein EBX52_10535, partial [Proteobacteria bacterium]|nr:hypothetical protein [Pseudomonadota bacterium]